MLRQFPMLCALTLCASAPLAAQMHHDDMDKTVKGGALPAGWMGRMDNSAEALPKIEKARFVAEGAGYHVTSGSAGVYWNAAKNTTSTPFTASVTIRQTKAPSHPEGYGVFLQGTNLGKANQSYAYFLIRGDGKFLVNHRAGEDIHKIVEWTENAAIHKADAKGVASNTMSVDATRPDSIRLKINGVQVHALAGDHFGKPDGVVGLRVNHNLDVAISDFVTTPKK